MKRFLLTAVLVISGGMALAGCEAILGAEGASVVATQKTISDHVVSLASGKDCSSIRRDRGLAYCKEDEIRPQMNVFCYQTLGQITCYDKPVYEGIQQRVGHGNEPPR